MATKLIATKPVSLTTDVTGTLPLGNGGTGLVSAGSFGNLVQSNGTSLVSAGPWQTVLDIDFTTHATLNLDANGTYTVGGIASVSKINSTNNNTFRITNGTGLVVDIGSKTSDYIQNNRSAPILHFPITSIANLANVDWSTGYRLWLTVLSETSAPNSNSGPFFAIDNNIANASINSTNTPYVQGIQRLGGVATTHMRSLLYANLQQFIAGSLTTAAAGNQCVMCQVPHRGVWPFNVSGYSGAAARIADTNLSLMNPQVRSVITDAGYSNTIMQSVNSFGNTSTYGFSLGVNNTAGAASYTATIGRIRVDVRL